MPSYFPARMAAALVMLAVSLASPIADACNSTAECSSPSVCNTTTHLCVGCIDNTPCRGPAPVCDVQAGFCASCNGDFGSANTQNCMAAHPICILSGPQTGECVDCSATNASACTTITRPVCAASLQVCGCNGDSDCTASTYCDHDVAPEGWCVFGCHVIGGVDRCPTGSHCDARDGTVGNCQAGMCGTDAECGASDSGKICAGGTCADGCRGSGGNGCASPLVCSSTDGSSGTCAPVVVMPDAGAHGDASTSSDSGADANAPIVAAAGIGGCSCDVPRSTANGSGLALLGVAAAIAAMRARRAPARKRACATPPSPSSIPK